MVEKIRLIKTSFPLMEGYYHRTQGVDNEDSV